VLMLGEVGVGVWGWSLEFGVWGSIDLSAAALPAWGLN
jgi:hypothetical protein